MNETVYQRASELLKFGVITKFTPVIDPVTGEQAINEDTGRPRQDPVNPEAATVWQCIYRQKGNLPANIHFPENDGAETFQDILEDSSGTVLYNLHRPLQDENGELIPLDRDPDKHQRGFYMLVCVCPPKRKRDKESPRNQLLSRMNEELPDLAELSSICTGEAMVAHLAQDSDTSEEAIDDLFSKLTYPRYTGDRTPADPEQVIFIRANSGFDGLYVNAPASGRARTASQPANLPADTEAADIFGTGS